MFPAFLSDEPRQIEAPRGLTKRERSEFFALIHARNDAGDPFLQTEVDALVDYVTARTRIARLRRMVRSAADFRAVLAAHRAVDSTTALSRRLGKQLRLG